MKKLFLMAVCTAFSTLAMAQNNKNESVNQGVDSRNTTIREDYSMNTLDISNTSKIEVAKTTEEHKPKALTQNPNSVLGPVANKPYFEVKQEPKIGYMETPKATNLRGNKKDKE